MQRVGRQAVGQDEERTHRRNDHAAEVIAARTTKPSASGSPGTAAGGRRYTARRRHREAGSTIVRGALHGVWHVKTTFVIPCRNFAFQKQNRRHLPLFSVASGIGCRLRPRSQQFHGAYRTPAFESKRWHAPKPGPSLPREIVKIRPTTFSRSARRCRRME